MTAIAYDGKVLAADRKVTAGHETVGYRRKLLQYNDGRVKGWFATSGDYVSGELFEQWINGKLKKFPKVDKDFAALFTAGSCVMYVDRQGVPYEAFKPECIGNGGRACEVLIRQGLTAVEAIKRVSKFNQTVGGKIDFIKVR